MSRRERQRRRRRNRGSPIKRVVAMTFVLTVCALAVGGLAVAGWGVNGAQSAPSIQSLKVQAPGQPTQVFASDGTSLGYIWSPVLHTSIAGGQIPALVKHATIAIEDRRFYQHGALDYQGLLRAAVKDALSGGNSLQGGSTLTMQLVDNLYLPPQIGATHNLRYKIIQAKLAEELASLHSKNWILDSYLNYVPYGTVGGQTAYGVEAASEMFFNEPVSQLNLTQAALLAGLPQAASGPAATRCCRRWSRPATSPRRTPTPPAAITWRSSTALRSPSSIPTFSTTSSNHWKRTCARVRRPTAPRSARAG